MRHPMLRRARLLQGASLVCLGVLGAVPASAQLAGLKAAATTAIRDLPANSIAAPGTNLGPVGIIRDQGSAAARQLATQQRLANTVGLVTQAQAAARGAAAALASTVPNGLATGGLQLAPSLVPAGQDTTGLHTLQGALTPTQTVSGGTTTVTITQTDSQALVSWTSFNVGKNTTVNLSQKANGVVQKDWVAFNRVVGQYDAATGRRDPSLAPAPSQILGHITADASVIIINPNGVLFSGASQVNAGSLLVSTLEIGRQIAIDFLGGRSPVSLAQRNDEFLRLGILGPADQGAGTGSTETFSASAISTVAGVVAEPALEGDIEVAAGAQLSIGNAGLLLLAAPHIVNAGSLGATEGQISLAAGRAVTLARTSGDTSTIAADIRGLEIIVPAQLPTTYIDNSGVITSARGYLSLSAGAGAILQRGLLTSTTSVSRNGFVDLSAADVQLSPDSTISITPTPDTDGETIPQSPDSVAAFKTSRVRIAGSTTPIGATNSAAATSRIEVGANALVYAPGGRVGIGTNIDGNLSADIASGGAASSRVFIDSGATIDVGGIKDFLVPAARNQVTISPAKRNELRDTPNYRESFLNGATIYVDPRRSGVRADGVAWVGSPLVEAESFYQQVGVTAAELLTKGGQVTLGTNAYSEFTGGARTNPTLAPDVIVKAGAAIDVSGGWVTYQAGQVQTSQLVTAGGQIVDIGNADPNGDYVGLVNPFTTTNTRFGVTDKFPNGTLQGVTTVGQYSEGRDAGALRIDAPAVALDGTVWGQAYAGALQRGNAVTGTARSTISGDARALQAAPSQLPAGALFAINPTGGAIAGDILVASAPAIPALPTGLAFGQSVAIAADGSLIRPERNPASLLGSARRDTIMLSDGALSGMGLGALTLDTSGELAFAPGTVTTLAPGGVLNATTGRSIRVDGNVSAPSGTIALATTAAINLVTATSTEFGSAFRADPPVAGSFDVTVNGTLSARGRFVNDFGLAPDQAEGGSFTRGGSVTLFAAPDVLTTIGAPANQATDLSGSILVNVGALVDVSGGATVGSTGTVNVGASGGNVSLFEETTYAQLSDNYVDPKFLSVRGLRFTVPASIPAGQAAAPLNPAAITARVAIVPGSIRAHGFAGGGIFTLTTPDLSFGDGIAAVGTQLPLNFLSEAGFGGAAITVLKTSLTPNRFVNTLGGFNAALQTDTVTVEARDTLSLVQSQFSPLLTGDQIVALQALANGGDLYTVVAPSVPIAPFDQQPIALRFGGLVEVDVAAGGRIEGAGGASLVAAKILDEGIIRLPGGSVTASETIPALYSSLDPTNAPIFAADLGQVFSTNAGGDIIETASNALGIKGPNGLPISNRDLAFARPIVLVGRLGGNEGLRVAPGATIDLAGISLVNPRAAAPNGAGIADGRLLNGGTLASVSRLESAGALFQARDAILTGALGGSVRVGQSLNLLPGATVDISGAADSYARLNAAGLYQPVPQWSDAGTIALEGGVVGAANAGTFSGATIRAFGGAPAATGGTLVVLDPVLAQVDDPARTINVVAANAVQADGFSTFVAEGTLNSAGSVGLALDRAFLVISRPNSGGAVSEANFIARIGATGALSVTAPLIRLTSIAQSVPDNTLGTRGMGMASFTADALDVQGAVLFDRSLASVTLAATQDLRLVGVQPLATTLQIGIAPTSSLQGQLLASGDLMLVAGQVYPTTGSSFAVASSGANATIRVAPSAEPTPTTPYSAGANLTIQAASIEQDGVVRAPLGTLTLGSNAALTVQTSGVPLTLAPATRSLHLASGSITSVSADGLSIPYGSTTDQIEYFFTPTIPTELTAPPAALLRLGGASVVLEKAATVDLSGGGDVFAFEFVPGVGGSRDVLDRLNADPFSSKTGFQYPDGRQVYAIVPGLSQPGQALIDPVYSADYGALTAASQVGRQVHLDASPGLEAGWYTLLPAHYALLPGGLRVVEQPEFGTAVSGQSTQLLDGTTVVGGYFGTAATGLHESGLRTFSVQSQKTFESYSQIATTSADSVFPARSARNGLASPRIPLDAGRLVISAITDITANARFATNAATGGRAATTDIGGTNFLIVGANAATAPPPGTITITAATLEALNSASLLIGGTRTDNSDGTTSLAVTGKTITVANDAASPLSAPELLFAVDGSASSITIADGASIVASGALGDARAGDYLISGGTVGQTGAGALLRFSTGPERQARRGNVQTVAVAPLLSVGLSHLAATTLLLDSSSDLKIASPSSGTADIAASQIAIGAGAVAFTKVEQPTGLTITPELQAAFAKTASLTIRSPQAIAFSGNSYVFDGLTLDTPAVTFLPGGAGAVALNTGALRLQNSAPMLATCAPSCGAATLAITAQSISFGSGQIRSLGFGAGVSFTAPGGVTFDGSDNSNATSNNGTAGFDAGSSPLAFATPFLGDRALTLMPGQSAVLPHLALTTTGTLTLTGVAGATAPVVTGTPGARLSLAGRDIAITDTVVVATAGALDARATNGIALGGTASLSTPGYARVFGDAADPTTVSAPGGLLTLVAGSGSIDLGPNTRLVVGGTVGQAGELRLVAANGAVNANGAINAAAPGGGGMFTFVSRGGFDLGHFAVASAAGFDQSIDIRSGVGDLALASGQGLKAREVRLTADGGATTIAGTIDASGVTGGTIGLHGETGVTLAPTGRLLARAAGYDASDSRQAKGGDVMLGTDGTGAITLAAGSLIDLSATRPGNRLLADVRNGTTFYRLAAGDVGGTLSIRAPLIEQAGGNTVQASAAGTVVGARDIAVEAFKQFDLGKISGDARFVGVTLAGGTVTLDPGTVAGQGKANFLADMAPGTIPNFIQAFSIASAAPGLGGLGSYRAQPGIELDYTGGVSVGTLTTDPRTGLVHATNWNLGAGTVDIPGAVAAGLMATNPTQPGQYYVIPGQEGAIFAGFTHLTYRVGGKVDGEPGVLTIRAGGTLDIKGSITDGFFAFRDQTTPEAISLAFGGGRLAFQPTLQPYCPNGDCSQVIAFDPRTANASTAVLIDFSGVNGPNFQPIGQDPVNLPVAYNPAANGPSASGGNSGDPIGTAEVFPRLPDGRIVRSSSYTLVGGADLSAVAGHPSVDPAAVNPASTGKVVVEGETSYAVNPIGEQGVFTNQLLVYADLFGGVGSGVAAVMPSTFVASFLQGNGGLNLAAGADSTTTITLQDSRGARDAGSRYLSAQGASFFAAHPGQAVFGTDPFTGAHQVSTTLALAGQFLTAVAPGYGALIASGSTGDAVPFSSPASPPAQATNYVRTLVRTGTGSISISAAGDVDTRYLDPVTGQAVMRPAAAGPNASTLLQVGGTAIYTTGTIADLSARTAADPSSGLSRTVDPGAYAQTASLFANGTPQPLVADALAADGLYLDDGGNIAVAAGGDVLGQRDTQGYRVNSFNAVSFIGGSDQPYRLGQIGPVTDVRANPQLFQSGVATLGGGSVSVRSARDISDLTIVANTSVMTADVTGAGISASRALVTTGGGDVALVAARDVVSGLLDVGEGTLTVRVGRDITSTGTVPILFADGTFVPRFSDAPRVRVADATAQLSAAAAITVRDVVSFGVGYRDDRNALGFYTPVAAFAAEANGKIAAESYGEEIPEASVVQFPNAAVLPGTLRIASVTSDVDLAPSGTDFLFLSPSPVGQLQIFAGANLRPVAIDMDDGDPGLLPGYFSTFAATSTTVTAGRLFTFPTVVSSTSDTTRRTYHNATGPTHATDAEPARVAAGGDIETLILNTPKQTRVSAGRDILNSAVFAQNLLQSDITRVAAGRDIVATTAIGQQVVNAQPTGPSLPYAQGNSFVIGGPGAFTLEAGRDAGPFLTSVVESSYPNNIPETLGGGVLSLGNEWNPYLAAAGANISIQFGVAHGVNYSGFRDTYLDPANVTALPDDQFAQVIDPFNRSLADRTRPIYAPVLLAWVQVNASAELLAAYGTTNVTTAQAYSVFKVLPSLRQRDLVQQVYFNELTQTSIPTSVSYLKYSRGYRAVNLLFPPASGYTANDLSGGGNTGTVPIETGNLDLRLATIQSSRGGNIDILGPGGRVLGGSTVRTSAQAARRLTIAERIYTGDSGANASFGPQLAAIQSIPTGYEGVITLRGGAIEGFVDQNFLLNQSRLFTEAGGDIALWSSNGDLNAGQGPKTSANFPPVVVRVGPNATSEVDAVGGVTGAGIAAFQPAPGVAAPNVFLIAPRGTVDAGDAGVRVAGNLFVAALAVANADNFAVGGSAFGIPQGPAVNVAAAAAGNAASAAAQQAASAASNATNRRQVDPLSRIVVDVLGYYGSQDPCDQSPRPRDCPLAHK